MEANGVEPSAKRRRRQLSWQAVSGQLLKPPTSVPLFSHFDRKLRKMVLRCLPGYRARHAIGVITRLSSLVAPRVVAAYIRSVCNGWSTLQCYQQRGRCRFGCGHPGDSLAHIAKCPRANAWGLQVGLLQRAPLGLELDYLLCMVPEAFYTRHSSRPLLTEDAVLQVRAYHLYALYRLHNAARHNSFIGIDMAGSYRGYYREGHLASELD